MPTRSRREAEGRNRILEIADRLADDSDGAEPASKQHSQGWISFALAGQAFALPVSHVRGVHRTGHITPLPNSPPEIRGLTNLRGRVIAVVDLATRLALDPTAVDGRSRILDAEIGRRRIGLLTMSTDSLIRVRPAEIQPLAGDAAAEVARRAAGQIDTRTGPVVLLDPDQLLEDAAGAPQANATEPRDKP